MKAVSSVILAAPGGNLADQLGKEYNLPLAQAVSELQPGVQSKHETARQNDHDKVDLPPPSGTRLVTRDPEDRSNR